MNEQAISGPYGHLSDEEIADKVRMLMRGDLDHEAVCMAARDRIRHLANEVDRLKTWDGLMATLDKFYPAEIFNGESGDPGPRIICLTRIIDAVRPLFDKHGPVTGSSEWQAAWDKAAAAIKRIG